VTFDIDANGILHVSAKDLGTGKEQKDLHHRQLRPLERGSGEDAARRGSSRGRGQEGEGSHRDQEQRDTLAYQCEKQLKDLGDKVAPEKRTQVEEAIKAVRDAIERNDTDAMKSTYETLQNKFQEISADLYKQASASTGPMPGAEAGGRPQPEPQAEPDPRGPRHPHGDVVDAEFEVVDEDKK
jgi:molecular chaperone DnaK